MLIVLLSSMPVIAKGVPQSKETIMKNLKKYGDAYLSNFDEKIRGDREIVLVAVKANGMALKYAVNTLKKDKKLVTAALKEDGRALQYAHESLKKNKECELQ